MLRDSPCPGTEGALPSRPLRSILARLLLSEGNGSLCLNVHVFKVTRDRAVRDAKRARLDFTEPRRSTEPRQPQIKCSQNKQIPDNPALRGWQEQLEQVKCSSSPPAACNLSVSRTQRQTKVSHVLQSSQFRLDSPRGARLHTNGCNLLSIKTSRANCFGALFFDHLRGR